MNTWRKKPVTQIITDAGPLMDLASADRLELLQSFGRPVLVVDVVREECVRKLGAPGEQRLSHWFDVGGGNQFQIVQTPFLAAYREALKKVETGEDPDATKGMGDATIAWLLANLTRLRTPNDIALVLTQDAPFGDGPVPRQNRAHVLSTREWLKTLERIGVIEKASDVIAEMEAGGRRIARYMADRPALIDKVTRSDWKEGSVKFAADADREQEALRNAQYETVCPKCNATPCICSSGTDGPGF